jgi:hypothetical protein
MGFNSGLKGLIQLFSWGWAQSCSKHVKDSNKCIIEETVRQVGYLPELYEDAQSEKYLKKCMVKITNYICTSVSLIAMHTCESETYSK